MAKLIVGLIGIVLICLVEGRHVHPRSIVRTQEMEDGFQDIDGMSVDVMRNMKPSRFVPFNNVLFFKSYAPCEEGFKRDLFGVCREVWD